MNSQDIGRVNRILEIGPGLNPIFSNLTEYEIVHVLEPIESLYLLNKKKIKNKPSIYIFNSTLEEFLNNSNKCSTYDLIVLSSVLHEIPAYRQALEECHSLLTKNGKIIIVVPNNKSLHRLIGAQNGLHPIGEKLTKTELTMQQIMSFSPESLEFELKEFGFETVLIKTEFIKIFPHAVMQELFNQSTLNEEILNFFSISSPFLPNLGAEIFYLGKKT